MRQVDEHATTQVGPRRTLRLMFFGMAMVLTMTAAAALPLLLLG